MLLALHFAVDTILAPKSANYFAGTWRVSLCPHEDVELDERVSPLKQSPLARQTGCCRGLLGSSTEPDCQDYS